MYDKDCIVDNDSYQDHEPQHGNDVEGLVGDENIDQEETDKPTGCSKRHTEHDDKGIEKIFKKSRHQEVAYKKCQNDVPLQGTPCARQVICSPAKLDSVEAAKFATGLDRSNDLIPN